MLVIIGLLAFYIYKAGEDARKQIVAEQAAPVETAVNVLDKSFPDPTKEDEINAILYLGESSEKRLLSGAFILNLNKDTKKLSFVYVPGDTKFEMSNDLYKSLAVSQTQIGQTVTTAYIYRYFKSENGLIAGTLMFNEYLGTDIEHYLYMPEEAVNAVFTKSDDGTFSLNANLYENMVNGDGAVMENIIDNNYKANYSDMSRAKLKRLCDEIGNINSQDITFSTIPGQQKNGGYFIDTDNAVMTLYGGSKE